MKGKNMIDQNIVMENMSRYIRGNEEPSPFFRIMEAETVQELLNIQLTTEEVLSLMQQVELQGRAVYDSGKKISQVVYSLSKAHHTPSKSRHLFI